MAISSLFLPAEGLMNQLRYPKKFILISLIFSLPIGFLSYLYLQSLTTEIAFLEKEAVGLEYIEHLRPLLEEIPKHRGMTNAYLNGKHELKDKILEQRKKVDLAFQELQKGDDEHGEELGTGADTDHAPTRLKAIWEDIKSRSFSAEASAIFEEHTLLIKHIIRHIKHLADLGNLTLDPELDSYYSIQLLTQSLPGLTEIMGRGRGFGSGIAAKGAIAPKEWAKLALLEGEIKTYRNTVHDSHEAIFSYNEDIKKELFDIGEKACDDVDGFTKLLKEKLLDADTITISSADIFSAGTKAISSSFELFDRTVPIVHNLFEQRITADKNLFIISTITIITVLIIVAYIFMGFYYSTLHTIDIMDKEMARIASGDLNAHVTLKTRDEMSLIGDRFNEMSSSFKELVGQVKDATNQVSSASTEMSAVTLQTSAGVSRQQQETEQVATAINEMNATVHEVANNAASAAEAASQANEEAINGQHIVDKAVESINQLAGEIENVSGVIHQLESDSENIGSVLDVIKNIAEQTNLLALNAAIEAARAGEQGRGFAVVADEVRTLASRTQQSTTEIEEMIDKLQDAAKTAVSTMEQGQTRTQQTVEQASTAGQSLAAITQSVSVINDMNTQIASAAEEQSAVAEEINQNINNISKISDETSVGAEKTQSHSEELSNLSESLQALLMRFKV